jgi:hypothetical protein
MLEKKDVAKVFETVMSIPGMGENVRVDLKMSRRNVLLLGRVIERGLAVKTPEGGPPDILDTVAKNVLDELSGVTGEMLEKAGLKDTYGLLKSL